MVAVLMAACAGGDPAPTESVLFSASLVADLRGYLGPALGTVTLGAEGSTADVALRTFRSDNCQFGAEIASFPARTAATIVEEIGGCDEVVYRLHVETDEASGAVTGFIGASETGELAAAGSPVGGDATETDRRGFDR